MDTRERLTTAANAATAVAIGERGPLRLMLDRLAEFGIGRRTLKTALAAGAAWQISRWITGDPLPLLAPITAFFTVDLTIKSSLKGTTERLVGVLIGVMLATIFGHAIGIEWWTVSLIVLFAILVGVRLKLEANLIGQIAVSAMLVAIVGGSGDFTHVASLHVANTIIGSVVGLALNALIAPPSYVPLAQARVANLARQIIDIQLSLSDALAGSVTPAHALDILVEARRVSSALGGADAALKRAEESLNYNLTGDGQLAAFRRVHRANRALEFSGVQTRLIARCVSESAIDLHEGRPSWLGDPALVITAVALFRSIADTVNAFSLLVTAPERLPAFTAAANRTHALRDSIASVGHLEGWVLLGELLAISDQLVSDLSDATIDMNPGS